MTTTLGVLSCFLYAPTLKKLKGHIALGMSVTNGPFLGTLNFRKSFTEETSFAYKGSL